MGRSNPTGWAAVGPIAPLEWQTAHQTSEIRGSPRGARALGRLARLPSTADLHKPIHRSKIDRSNGEQSAPGAVSSDSEARRANRTRLRRSDRHVALRGARRRARSHRDLPRRGRGRALSLSRARRARARAWWNRQEQAAAGPLRAPARERARRRLRRRARAPLRTCPDPADLRRRRRSGARARARRRGRTRSTRRPSAGARARHRRGTRHRRGGDRRVARGPLPERQHRDHRLAQRAQPRAARRRPPWRRPGRARARAAQHRREHGLPRTPRLRRGAREGRRAARRWSPARPRALRGGRAVWQCADAVARGLPRAGRRALLRPRARHPQRRPSQRAADLLLAPLHDRGAAHRAARRRRARRLRLAAAHVVHRGDAAGARPARDRARGDPRRSPLAQPRGVPAAPPPLVPLRGRSHDAAAWDRARRLRADPRAARRAAGDASVQPPAGRLRRLARRGDGGGPARDRGAGPSARGARGRGARRAVVRLSAVGLRRRARARSQRRRFRRGAARRSRGGRGRGARRRDARDRAVRGGAALDGAGRVRSLADGRRRAVRADAAHDPLRDDLRCADVPATGARLRVPRDAPRLRLAAAPAGTRAGGRLRARRAVV